MKNYTLAILISSFIFTACGAPAPTNTNAGNVANSTQNQAAANTNSTANSTANLTANSTANSTAASASSPMETIKSLAQAAKTKDAATIKSLVSKGTIALLEEEARENKTTVDEMLKSDDEAIFEELPEMRNENIAGDKATVEIKDKESNEWSTLPFVKEDGAWKIALDEYLKEIEQRMLEDMKKKPAVSGKEKEADKKDASANKAANK